MQYLTPEIVKNKRILMRVDFNVDLDDKGNIVDDFRIVQTLPTIEFLLNNQAKKIILISHLGRPQEENNFQKFTLKPIQLYLEKLLNKKVYFIKDFLKQKQEINEIPSGNIILLENIRFYPEEEKNDLTFAKQLSELGDIYINEAFSVSHRKVASLVALPQLLPHYGGLLLKKEIENLNQIKNAINEKLVVVFGGSKIEDKLPLINNFLNKARYILVGGALANTIIYSWSFEVGESLIEKEMLEAAKNLGSQKGELVIPGDYLVLTKNNKIEKRGLGEISKTEKIFDIGPIAAKTFGKILKKADLIFWNGPMGKIEDSRFRDGTKIIWNSILENKKAKTVIGGGDTLTSLKLINQNKKLNIPDNIFLSTGGGAMLEYLADTNLPGLEVLN